MTRHSSLPLQEVSPAGGACATAACAGAQNNTPVVQWTPISDLEGGCKPDELSCLDSEDDSIFYRHPRLLQHVDTEFRERLRSLYADRLPPGGAVLDLCASWDSHLPLDVAYGSVVAVGINKAELKANPQVSRYISQDLNRDPLLPSVETGSVDAVLCCNGFQYLRRPAEVWAEMRRVLKPGGLVIVSFSTHMFVEKAVTGWIDRNMTERAKLVAWYLSNAGLGANARFLLQDKPSQGEEETVPNTITDHAIEEARLHHHHHHAAHDAFCAVSSQAESGDEGGGAALGQQQMTGLQNLQTVGHVPLAAQALQEMELLGPQHPPSPHTLERWRQAYASMSEDARSLGIPASAVPSLPGDADADSIRMARESLSNMMASFISSGL